MYCMYLFSKLGMALCIQLCVASFVIFESRHIFPLKVMDYIKHTNSSLATKAHVLHSGHLQALMPCSVFVSVSLTALASFVFQSFQL